ncbi:sororin-like, partial [Acipenser ruthenus]|uniref:sororin-like n=1 Tax=Acipenser ruthenus TaxID=7906 RepID=UPI00274279F8
GVFSASRRSPRVSDAAPQIHRSPRGSLLSSGEADKENAVRRPSSSSSSSSPSKNAKNSENNSPIRNGRDALNVSNRKSSRNDPRSKNTLSPVAPSAGRAGAPPNEEPRDQPNLIWSKKVRRSYSRLSAGSFDGTPSGSPLPPRPDRLSLFGFEGLCGVSPVRGGGGRSLLEGAGAGVAETSPPAAEQDFDIPGVALVKEKRRRKKKVQQIQMSELDCLAALMNAEFDAAEEFDLCVE